MQASAPIKKSANGRSFIICFRLPTGKVYDRVISSTVVRGASLYA